MKAMWGIAVILVGCGKSQEAAPKPAPSTKSPSTWALVAPSATPCTTDAECMVWMNPCDCSCNGVLTPGPQVSKEQWSKECSDGPGKNCGAAYPCANVRSICDATSKTCKTSR